MKKRTKKQQAMADKAVNLLKKLYDEGVWTMSFDGGGGRNGLTFWRPTEDENFYLYEIVSHRDNVKYDEFIKKSYKPHESIGLPIDIICPYIFKKFNGFPNLVV